MPENDKDRGLYPKYRGLEKADGTPVEGWYFVLREGDPLAVPALATYAQAAHGAGYHHLAEDLKEKARQMASSIAGYPATRESVIRAVGHKPTPGTPADVLWGYLWRKDTERN